MARGKGYILVDDNNIIRCFSTHEINLHKDKLHMIKYYTNLDEIQCEDFIFYKELSTSTAPT